MRVVKFGLVEGSKEGKWNGTQMDQTCTTCECRLLIGRQVPYSVPIWPDALPICSGDSEVTKSSRLPFFWFFYCIYCRGVHCATLL